jgi:CRP-like cAMP-binding protein
MDFNNHFLDSLRAEDLKALEPHLERLEIERDQLLAEAGSLVEAVYLPIRSVISVVALMQDGRSVETRTVGCESGFGLLHALGSPYSFERVICQIGGEAWRVPLEGLTQASIASPTLVKSIARHAQATLLQAAQSTACNTLHSAEQRLCRWLLLCRERLGADTLPLTQEHLSVMLGVQRTTITAIASELQARGLVSYSRGRIQLLDIPALMSSACECYEAIEGAIERMIESEKA